MKKVRVAINGFGRIGRAFFRAAHGRDEIDIVAINDLGDVENLVYLLKYDTVYGKAGYDIHVDGNAIVVDGKRIAFISEREPTKLPWREHDIDIALESTGIFASYEQAKVHIEAGAKRVVVSAPVKDDPEAAGISGATVLMGVNEQDLNTCDVSSNASCTTNAGSPLISILHEALGIEKALLNTVHAYTSTQSLIDAPNKKDLRRGRAAAQNIIPGSTGAAIATTKAITDLEGKFDGIAIRVPVPVGSIVDITFLTKQETTAEEVNDILKKAAGSDRWRDIFATTEEPLVSSDIVGAHHASIADLSFTRVAGGNLVKVLAWYDNETSYTHTLVNHVITSGQHVA